MSARILNLDERIHSVLQTNSIELEWIAMPLELVCVHGSCNTTIPFGAAPAGLGCLINGMLCSLTPHRSDLSIPIYMCWPVHCGISWVSKLSGFWLTTWTYQLCRYISHWQFDIQDLGDSRTIIVNYIFKK